MTPLSELVSTHPFLAGLEPHALSQLSTWARRVAFRAGTTIFAEGGKATSFWLIVDGHVRLDTYVPGRGGVAVESLGPGAVLGWSWMFPPHRWHFGATAVESTTAVEFDGAGIRQLCDLDPVLGHELTRRFMGVVVDRLQATRVRLLDLYGSP
jgi:CRP-like cAMP-binding protein